ncbi:hypothetical protein [Pseudomonas sp. R5-89-07]|uniref:hypothetical protein n=1 Tax=Pseudomonas sp. R5-89-07 TaxID=658644 RepID=UPI000F5866D9|nr:hypothetical protein [Pseudomonas sp. R5-89-07]AZF05989.1 hypothetical protein C4J94_3223 [Pseudomonas sp. R5-89-07]
MKMGKVAGAVAFAAMVVISGCASIVSDSKPKVGLYSVPTNANYVIKNSNGAVLSKGVTPGTALLETSRGYFKSQSYTVTFQKEGYTETTVPLKSTVSGWYWGNLLIGGLIGMLIVDPLTGAMYTLPDDATGKLSAVSLPASSQPQASTSAKLIAN